MKKLSKTNIIALIIILILVVSNAVTLIFLINFDSINNPFDMICDNPGLPSVQGKILEVHKGYVIAEITQCESKSFYYHYKDLRVDNIKKGDIVTVNYENLNNTETENKELKLKKGYIFYAYFDVDKITYNKNNYATFNVDEIVIPDYLNSVFEYKDPVRKSD